MTKAIVACAATVALIASHGVGAAASLPTPTRIEASVRQRGAQATMAILAEAGQWDAVAAKMGDGGSAWVALAPKLAPGADAGSAEALGISLAFALPRNPRAVLAAIDPANGHVLGADRVCGMPFIEDTVKDRPAYRRQALRAVARVSDRSLANARAACLSALDAAR